MTRERKQQEPGRTRKGSIVLISVPGFAHGWVPLNIARLKASLLECGHDAVALPLCVQFSEFIRTRHPQYRSLDAEIGEFGQSWHELYFATSLFGHATPETLISDTLADSLRNRDIFKTQFGVRPRPAQLAPPQLRASTARVLRFCRLMENFLVRRLARIDWTTVDAVGFSCMTSQVLTSIYLARALKARTGGSIITILGGPHFEPYNTPAFARAFPEIDHFVAGDGEGVLSALLERQVVDRVTVNRSALPTASIQIDGRPANLAPLPAPDYQDAGVNLSRERYSLATSIAKGCSHGLCSFCGIDGPGRQGRSPDEVFQEISHLVTTYRTKNINFGDWEINGDSNQLEALCDKLIQAGIRIWAWAEMNARNSSPRLLRKMSKAGISSVQIGVESFSAELLRRISKPATVVDNIKVLRWGIEAGMDCLHFNLLCNHPGTTNEDVLETRRVLHSIAHLLRRPVSMVFNEMDLYRPSRLFKHAGRLGLTGVRDFLFFRRCYPDARIGALPMFSVNFDGPPLDPLWKTLAAFAARVRRRPVRLEARRTREGLQILDTRDRRRRVTLVTGLDARVLELLGEAVMREVELAGALGAPRPEVAAAIQRLRDADWIIEEKGRLLALPIRKYHEAVQAATTEDV